ncbi:MAG: hypothetical protein MHPSP_003785, partial [Paramarteilia canceri]
SDEGLDETLFAFGQNLFLSISLFDIFIKFNLEDYDYYDKNNSSFQLKLLEWLENFGRTSQETDWMQDHSLEGIKSKILSEALVFSSKNSLKYLKMLPKEFLTENIYKEIENILISCPVGKNNL